MSVDPFLSNVDNEGQSSPSSETRTINVFLGGARNFLLSKVTVGCGTSLYLEQISLACYDDSLCYIMLINTKLIKSSITYIQSTRPVAPWPPECLSPGQTQTHSEVPVEAADSNLQRKSITLPGTKSNIRRPEAGRPAGGAASEGRKEKCHNC